MVGRDVRYVVRHPIRAVTNVLSDPLEAWTFVQDRYAARREATHPPNYTKPRLIGNGDFIVCSAFRGRVRQLQNSGHCGLK